MISQGLLRILPAALAAALAFAGCSKQEAEPAAEPAQTAPAEAAAPAATAAADAGATTYKTFCVTCHGQGGHGDGPAAAGLSPKPADFSAGAFRLDANGNGVKGEVEDIQAVVRDGAAKHGGSPLMAPWPMLSPEQLKAVAEHVKSLQTG